MTLVFICYAIEIIVVCSLQIWNHPGILQLMKENKDNIRREDPVENFLVDDCSSDENMDYNVISGGNISEFVM